METGPGIHDQQYPFGLGDGNFGLFQNLFRDQIVIIGQHPARVHQHESAAIAVHRVINPVAGNARLIADDRPPLAGDRVEEG